MFLSSDRAGTFSRSGEIIRASSNQGSEPALQAVRCLADKRDNRLPPKGLIGLAVIGVGIIARQAEQHGRYAKGERDFAGGFPAGLNKVHIGRRKAHGFPIQSAFQNQWAARMARPGMAGFKFGFQSLKLIFGEMVRAARPFIDKRPTRAGGIFQQSLRPSTALIMEIHGLRRCLQGRD